MVVITPLKLHSPDAISSEARRRPLPRRSGVAGALAFAAADSIALALSLAAALWAESRFPGAGSGVDQVSLDAVLAGLALLLVPAFAVRRHAEHLLGQDEPSDLLAACAAAFVASGFVGYAFHLDGGLVPLVVMWGIAGPAMLVCRRLARVGLDRAGVRRPQVVVVGSGEAATQAVTMVEARGHCAVTGVVHPDRLAAMTRGRWTQVLRQQQADLVLLALTEVPRSWVEWLVRDGVPFMTVSRQNGLPVLGGVASGALGQDAVVWSYRNNLHRPAARAGKVALDMVVTSTVLLLLAPLLALIAVAIKLDGGAVLYAHRRIGADGRSFPCLKFRSMVPNSDEVLAQVLRTDPARAAEWLAKRKLRHDPRVTFIGRFLRQTSLDELPQLLNVLRGEMSLVGPRPIVQEEVPRYGEDIHYYYATRPGITGLWQVSGRSDTGYMQRVQLDTWYVKNWSFWYDVLILWRTVPAVLARRGAV